MCQLVEEAFVPCGVGLLRLDGCWGGRDGGRGICTGVAWAVTCESAVIWARDIISMDVVVWSVMCSKVQRKPVL